MSNQNNGGGRPKGGTRIIDMLREKFTRKTTWEYCVHCGQRTDVKRSEHIKNRKYYVEGAGQLCPGCYMKTQM